MLRAAPNSVPNMSAEGFNFDMVAFKEEINGTTAKGIFFSKNESFFAERIHQVNLNCWIGDCINRSGWSHRCEMLVSIEHFHEGTALDCWLSCSKIHRTAPNCVCSVVQILKRLSVRNWQKYLFSEVMLVLNVDFVNRFVTAVILVSNVDVTSMSRRVEEM